MARQKHMTKQMLGIWFCVLAVCLGIIFPNVETKAAETDAQVTLKVAQVLDIKDTVLPESEQEFIYILERIESRSPLPQGHEENKYFFTLTGNQNMTLAPLTFTTVGEYHYRLQLLESKSDKEFTYDTEVYEITVFVTERGGRLRADTIAVNQAGFKNEELSFTHSYEEMGNLPPNILDPNPTEPNPVEPNPTDTNPLDPTPADPNPLDPNPADQAPQPNPQAGTPPTSSDLGNQTGKMASGVKTGDLAQGVLFAGVGLLAFLMILVVLVNRKRMHYIKQ